MHNEVTWCLSKTNSVYWAEWEDDDEAVIYIESTGETALVSLLSLSLLEAIADKPQTIKRLQTLVSNLTDEQEKIEEQELLSAIKISLAQLRQFDIIEPCRH